jgi:hypothetical protein
MRRCQIEFNAALVARSKITTENDRLSREQRDLLAENAEAQATWVTRIVELPPEIRDLPDGDPRLTQYGRTVTRIWAQRTAQINERIRQIAVRQLELDKQRADNPLPEPSCGR